MKKAKTVQSIKSNMFTPYEDCLIASSVLLSNSLFVVFVWTENHSRKQIRTSPTNGRSMVNVGKTLASNLRYEVRAHHLVAKKQNILDHNTAYILANRYEHNSRSTPVAQLAPRNLLTRWDVSSIPANGIFLTKNKKKQKKNAQRVEND